MFEEDESTVLYTEYFVDKAKKQLSAKRNFINFINNLHPTAPKVEKKELKKGTPSRNRGGTQGNRARGCHQPSPADPSQKEEGIYSNQQRLGTENQFANCNNRKNSSNWGGKSHAPHVNLLSHPDRLGMLWCE